VGLVEARHGAGRRVACRAVRGAAVVHDRRCGPENGSDVALDAGDTASRGRGGHGSGAAVVDELGQCRASGRHVDDDTGRRDSTDVGRHDCRRTSGDLSHGCHGAAERDNSGPNRTDFAHAHIDCRSAGRGLGAGWTV
jgi:hypothetical protein